MRPCMRRIFVQHACRIHESAGTPAAKRAGSPWARAHVGILYILHILDMTTNAGFDVPATVGLNMTV